MIATQAYAPEGEGPEVGAVEHTLCKDGDTAEESSLSAPPVPKVHNVCMYACMHASTAEENLSLRAACANASIDGLVFD